MWARYSAASSTGTCSSTSFQYTSVGAPGRSVAASCRKSPTSSPSAYRGPNLGDGPLAHRGRHLDAAHVVPVAAHLVQQHARAVANLEQPRPALAARHLPLEQPQHEPAVLLVETPSPAAARPPRRDRGPPAPPGEPGSSKSCRRPDRRSATAAATRRETRQSPGRISAPAPTATGGAAPRSSPSSDAVWPLASITVPGSGGAGSAGGVAAGSG